MVLITGGEGMVARAFHARLEAAGRPFTAPGRAELDITDRTAVRMALDRLRPALVLHCAAFTGVDRAESEPEAARRVNVEGTRHLIEAADAVGARVVHLSTDYVFGSAVSPGTPIPPDTPRDPISVYGRTKAEAEEVVEASAGDHLIVRTSWVFGPGGRNFVDTMVGLAEREVVRVVDDQTGRPTRTDDLAATVLALADAGATGVLHVASRGRTTWAEFARRIFARIGAATRVEGVSTEEYGAPAPRPRWSVLDLSATEAVLGRPLPHWSEALDTHLTAAGIRLEPLAPTRPPPDTES